MAVLAACSSSAATYPQTAPSATTMSSLTFDEGTLTAELLGGLAKFYPQNPGESNSAWCTTISIDPPSSPAITLNNGESLAPLQGGSSTIYAACVAVIKNGSA